MKIARVTGSCVATQKACGLQAQRMLILQPLSFDLEARGLPLIAVDTMQSCQGELVLFVQSREAANSLEDSFCAIDAAIVGIVDDLGMTTGAVGENAALAWLSGSSSGVKT